MSNARKRLETIAMAAALVLVAAFVTSAIVGVVHRPAKEAVVHAPGAVTLPAPAAPRGRVEVLNAAGRSGLARAATDQLREAGFDVVYFGTTRSSSDSSVVIDRVGRRDIADAAARTLEITTVRTQKDSTLLLDATVVVGIDWRKRQVAAQQQSGWRAKIRKWIGR